MINLLPALLLGLVVSTLMATALHVLRGQHMRALLPFWLTVQVGFWLAAVVAAIVRAPLYTVGELQLIAGIAGGLLAAALSIVTQKRV